MAYKKKSKKVKKVIVRTWGANFKSISLFKKLGFKKYKTIKNQRINGDSSVWFKKEL